MLMIAMIKWNKVGFIVRFKLWIYCLIINTRKNGLNSHRPGFKSGLYHLLVRGHGQATKTLKSGFLKCYKY